MTGPDARRSAVAALAVLAALAPVAARPASAQTPAAADTATVPRLLAAAIVGAVTPNGATRIVVGRLPEGLPSDLVPAGPTRPIGGLLPDTTHRDFPGYVLGVLRDPRPVDSVRIALDAHLARTGWREPERAPDPMHVVFASDAPERMRGVRCRDGRQLMRSVGPLPAPERGALVVLTLGRWRGGPCDPRAGQRPGAPFDDIPSPTLRPLPGTTIRHAGSSASDRRRETTALVTTTAGADSLLAHYARQLAADGWTLGAPLAGGGIAVRTGTKRVGDVDWSALLLVQTLAGSGALEVSLRVSRPPERD